MVLNGEYEPSPAKWVRDQVQEYEGSGGTEGTMMRNMPVIIVTTLGARSGKVRKVPLMRVEHDGEYAHPELEVRDGTVVQAMTAREVAGEEKAIWWERCVAAFPDYASYQAKTERVIPVFVLTASRASSQEVGPDGDGVPRTTG
jgi:hypothetical protein